MLNVALSNNASTSPLPIYGLPAGSRAARAQTGAGLSRAPSETSHVQVGLVPVRTLDGVLASWGLLQPGGLLVKVDTEGFDVHVLAGGACALRHGAIDVLQIEWNRRKLAAAAPACVSLRRVALLLERYGYDAYLVGRPYVALNFGAWDEAYEGRDLPCPPRCTGDVVAIRRGWHAREAVVRELVRTTPSNARASGAKGARAAAPWPRAASGALTRRPVTPRLALPAALSRRVQNQISHSS